MIQLKESREKLELANQSAHRLHSLQVLRNWTRQSKARSFRMRCTNMGTEPLNLQFYVTMSINILESLSTMSCGMCSRQASPNQDTCPTFQHEVHHKLQSFECSLLAISLQCRGRGHHNLNILDVKLAN